MSVDTLFDYLESAEGSGTLYALSVGDLGVTDLRELCALHGVDEHAYRLMKVSVRSLAQLREQNHLERIESELREPLR